MIQIEQNGLQWLEFELLANYPEVTHAIFTRHGGGSHGAFESLNLSNSVGDTLENVEENRQKIIGALDLPLLITAKQCHGINIATVTSSAITEFSECDALMTQSKNLGLMILQADCQAAIFYDPTHHALANVHCGWRGSVQNIYQHTILQMKKEFHTKPKDLIVCISPSLGPENSQFINYKTELPESFWEFQTCPNYFNFWDISEWQLTQAGLLPHHIQIARIDTFANPQDYFSYRRSNSSSKNTGRQATICALA
ncbi:MAG: peptidoglycan editing factor PgeF [Parachlamydiaceae bacterium]|nr:peptidoglycan editing factor PgeF [Parachlamydiaceae bacterium]